MSYEKVAQAKKLIIGSKQTVKAIETGSVIELVVANDADARVTAKAIEAAVKMNVPVSYVDSMRKLGKACEIDVGAATVAITR